MNFNQHLKLEGLHAPFSASKSSWLRYDDTKAIEVYRNLKMAQLGTRLHAWAKETIDLIELRRGCQDLSLGDSKYAQVRIMVDGKKYLKGMAVYSDDMPDGVDVIFNTNKTKDVPKMEVLKDIKSDPDNPFGSLIKDADQGGQYWYKDAKTGEEKLGLIAYNNRSHIHPYTDRP